VLDQDRDHGFQPGGGFGWEEDPLDTSGWSQVAPWPEAEAEWARGGDAEWEAVAPTIKKEEEEEPVLVWPEEGKDLGTLYVPTPPPSPRSNSEFF
jgi:hypothetical protein